MILLNLGCSSGISGAGIHRLERPDPPRAVTDPRSAWKVENGRLYSLAQKDFEALRRFVIRQDEVLDKYDCMITAINGGSCE